MRHTNLHLNISSINNNPKLHMNHSFNSTKSAAGTPSTALLNSKKNQQQLF